MSATLTRNFYLPTDDEDTAIRSGIALDSDTYELSDIEISQLKPKRPGRPRVAHTKRRLTIRLSPDVVAAFRATGAGWQTRIDTALKDWLATHANIDNL
ncbi:MAG: BrnA antitoxin family protein [Methylovulum miyakonense]|uniref:BrnA antitoxin family protein n=1 Tax=Methylovulum miyakonense TaxID=645578 RepID=UPI003BB72639